MQVLICLLGQGEIFQKASELFRELMNIHISDNQILRVCEHYGSILEKGIIKNISSAIAELKSKIKDEITYIMLDGSMLLTKKFKWKEIKLCRIFKQSQNIGIQEHRNKITKSVFVSHLGGVNKFFLKVERHLTTYKNKVFIGDGASWIWKWVENNYPGAIQILDFYHAFEKLCALAANHFKDVEKRNEWIEAIKQKLLNDQVADVIDEIKSLKVTKVISEQKSKLVSYYTTHEDRMLYKTFRDKGLMIGSGPIEASHINVIQQRMKLAGQRWTFNGANAVATLRCFHSGGNWERVVNCVKLAA